MLQLCRLVRLDIAFEKQALHQQISVASTLYIFFCSPLSFPCSASCAPPASSVICGTAGDSSVVARTWYVYFRIHRNGVSAGLFAALADFCLFAFELVMNASLLVSYFDPRGLF